MPAHVKHKKIALQPDDPQYEINSTEWNDEHDVVMPQGLETTDTPTFAGLVLSDPLGNKWLMTVTEDGNVSMEALPLP